MAEFILLAVAPLSVEGGLGDAGRDTFAELEAELLFVRALPPDHCASELAAASTTLLGTGAGVGCTTVVGVATRAIRGRSGAGA